MSVIELYQQWKNEDLPNYLKEELEQIAENFLCD